MKTSVWPQSCTAFEKLSLNILNLLICHSSFNTHSYIWRKRYSNQSQGFKKERRKALYDPVTVNQEAHKQQCQTVCFLRLKEWASEPRSSCFARQMKVGAVRGINARPWKELERSFIAGDNMTVWALSNRFNNTHWDPLQLWVLYKQCSIQRIWVNLGQCDGSGNLL